ncbi:MAG: acyl-CoA thioesterase [Muribaculaceae bacterium]|nr:acyl-CoA thioesterase [Muribaculaceae bacterium]MDE7190002.1 acyl-CoA thioesterase [Muribaculaceae bacterium]
MDIHNLPDPQDFKHRVLVQTRFNDVDILGHINNTVYFSFYDTGKAYYFNSVRKGNMNWRKVETVIANVNCAYIHSMYFGEQIEVCTRCIEIREKSFILQQMLVEKESGQIKSVCETVMVSIDTDDLHSIPVPDDWRKALADYEGRNLDIPQPR